MTSRRFSQVDVFGQDPGTGNPVAVVLDAEGLDDATMRRFSVWSNLSECTFVLPPTDPGADYRVRIFSLNKELPFAGHPTLGTARAWLEAGGAPRTPGTIIQQCEAGLIPITIDGDTLAFQAPERLRTGPVDADLVATLSQMLGIDRSCIVDAEWLDNGPGWVGLLLDSAETVLSLKPDASQHPGRWDIGVIGAHAVASEDSQEPAWEVRAFFTEGTEPLREDPVTGSLNAAAAQWLLSTGRATAPYVAAQGTAIGRAGRVHITADEDQSEIWVGGRATSVIQGTITL
ncbi:PhzF family phenazine biosynthesis protein [Corynebacterium sp. 320]|uniref:PhzF family phenazine biosynthesis protein n=1 Tax=Corynebacterium TaxID=1716 RepID=UPI00125CB9A7|nr:MULTISPECIES: PhzF family phenazine biosynthesis protein [Corynebacterium]KAB1503838.1 PhzF family phenazine biosynthesis protein [Corynebacterium sp. 320]KAB1553061.1 PhzF family phenazine biosynthesis protein [Corynebacterium sp. 321]KAB1553718.1 PhzF family phenazine biosynthesis protein [Corynebacterium sp. 319]KAB3527974.1 PhzF family phenazine biosynthesis protein [Corynebacterium sp. 250]KAB3540536.1 PhzF family phenazine biosynthesis protein [Corynebacterium sp. 366]